MKEPEWIQSYITRTGKISSVIYPDFGNIKLTSCNNLSKYLDSPAQSLSYAMAWINEDPFINNTGFSGGTFKLLYGEHDFGNGFGRSSDR